MISSPSTRRKTARLSAGVLVVASAGVLAACGSSSSSSTPTTAAPAATNSGSTTAARTNDKVIAFNTGASADPFFVAMEISADAEAKAKGYTIQWQGDPTVYSPATQIPILSQQLVTKPAGLIIAPTDPNALQSGVNQFVSAGIPVVNVDTHVADLSKVTAFITGNNIEGGQKAADALAAAMHYKAGQTYQVTVGMTSATTTTNADRLAGFKMEIAAKYPGIKIVSVAYSQAEAAQANSNVSNWLSTYPNLKGIFAIDGSNATGASSAIEAHNLVGKVALVGYDAYANNVALLQKGVFSALIAQDPTLEAKMAVDDIVAALSGNKSTITHEVTLPNIVLTPTTSASALAADTYPAP